MGIDIEGLGLSTIAAMVAEAISCLLVGDTSGKGDEENKLLTDRESDGDSELTDYDSAKESEMATSKPKANCDPSEELMGAICLKLKELVILLYLFVVKALLCL